MTNKKRTYIICTFLLLTVGMMFILHGCFSLGQLAEKANEAEGGKFTTLVKDKPIFIFRADYKTEEDFENAVLFKVLWLHKHEYRVYKIEIIPGKDMTGKEESKYAVIYYRVREGT